MDPLTDTILVGTGMEIIPAITSFLNSFADLFGEEATTALIQGVAAIGQSDIRAALASAVISDGGQITFVQLPEIISAENQQVILNSLNTISKAMYQRGISVATATGKDILAATWEKIKTYGPALSSAAIGTYIGQSLAEIAQNKATELKTAAIDKATELKQKISPGLGINNN